MTKRVRSDCRPYDIRPVSLIPFGQVKSQDALDILSRYEEVSRQFAQEFPQMAWNLEQQHSWIPCFLSPYTGRQENRTTAPTIDATAADSSASPTRGQACDSEYAALSDYNISMYDGGDYLGGLPLSMTTATTPSDEQSNPDSLTPLDPDADFDPSCDLEALTSQLLWHNEVQEARFNCALQNRNEEQMGKQWDGSCPTISESPVTQPVEQRQPSDFDDEALAEASRIDRDKMNQIMIDLNHLGSRLREDARRQLDAISDDICL